MTNPYVDERSHLSVDDYGLILTKGPDGDAPGDAWFQGIPAIEDGEQLAKGIAEGDWVGILVGATGVSLDVLAAAFDPIGTASSYIAGWMLEHVTPLRMALDGLAGNPEVIRGYAATWQTVGMELRSAHHDLEALIDPGTQSWQGRAAEYYRASAHGVAKLLATASSGALTMSMIVTVAGELVAAVRKTVRDIIAILVGILVNATIELLGSGGLLAGLVTEQVTLEILRCVQRVSKLVARLLEVLTEIAVFIDAAKRLVDNAVKAWRASPFSDRTGH
ncbi:MAG TPA: hypothetical protein VM677_32895 [Actinokineospora sp.]|nr:hypothetical protein [Actinokineospora sp.]